MATEPKTGAYGRTTIGSPARYIGGGLGLFVSAQDNSIGAATWANELPEPPMFPVPSDNDVWLARTVIQAMTKPLSDLDSLKAMFNRTGVVYSVANVSEQRVVRESKVPAGTAIEIEVRAGDNPQNMGYSGFSTTYHFSLDGKLLAHGSWEG